MAQIAENLNKIKQDIVKICQKYDKKPENVNLIAVSKTIISEKIEEAIKWGCQDFGENRVEEAAEKWPNLQTKYHENNLKLHLIGHLQSKKAKKAVEIFDFIHSLDNLKLAKILKKEIEKQQKSPKIFIQINIGDEENKSGIALKEADNFIDEVKNNVQLPIFGLMCIPPIDSEPSLYFALMNKIAQKHHIENLSMGMSSDYEAAIALDANYIRVGTAIFGKRDNTKSNLT